MSIRILFVDDEPRVLEGLQRSLRGLRKEWSLAFAPSGEAALEVLSREPFDVIVTDMRMPGMDGAALLQQVTARYPDTLRIVLSGQSDLESVLKSAGVTHQFLSKPCSASALKDAVNRAVALRDRLADRTLKQLVSRLGSIPSVPPLFVELTACLKSEKVHIEKISGIIRKDMGMTAKVLQLVNSSFFGPAAKISSVAHAVTYLGLETIRALLLTLHAFSEFKPGAAPSFSMEALWRHSLATGALAERILQTIPSNGKVELDQMRVVGLLHDVGRLILASNVPEKYEQAHALEKEKRLLHWEAEQQVFGATHAEVGAYLLGLWGLPEPMVEVIAYHHAPQNCPHPDAAMLIALYAADALDNAGGRPETEQFGLDLQYLGSLGLDGRLPEWHVLGREAAAEQPLYG